MTRADLQALLEQFPMPSCVIQGGRMLAANQLLTRLLGYSAEQLTSAENVIFDFVAPEEQQAMLLRYQARLRGEPMPTEYDFRARGPDGHPIPMRMRIAEFPPGGPGALLYVFSDERLRARSAELIRGFVEVAVAAQQQRTQVEFFHAVRERLRALGLTSTLLEIDGDRFRFSPLAPAITPAGEEMRAIFNGWKPLADVPIDLTRAEGTLVEDLPGFLARLGGLPDGAFVRRVPSRAVVAAVRVEGEPRYVLSCSGDDLDPAVASGFALLGRQLGAALETTRRLEELDRRNAELSLLLDLGQEVVGALDLAQVLSAAARTASRTLRCSCAYVFLADPSGTMLRVAAREDPDPPPELPLGAELPVGAGWLSGLAFRTQRAYASTDNVADSRVDAEIVRRFRCQATLAVPLLSHGRSLGVLSLFERTGRIFDAQDVRLASHAAQLTAAALENARLYAEQRARAEEMALLNEVARRLAGSLDARRLLEVGGEAMRTLLDADYWFALVPDLPRGGLRFEAVAESERDLLGKVLRFDEPSMAATAWRERRVVQLANPLSSPAPVSRELATRFGNRVTLAAPLVARDECLGVAVVLARKRENVFSQAEMDRALAVSGQLGLALLSARLYEDLKSSYAELARTQNELIDRERLAALGELSASIAHEVRNPLGVVFNSVGSLRRLLKPEGDVALLLDIVGEEADRLNRMVGDLLDYSRPVRPALQPVPLQPLLEEAVAAARQQIGPGADLVKVQLEVAPETATVRADARLLRQALINLFLNAWQSMPRGGRLEVRATQGTLDGRPCAEIAISDTGPGIPPDARDKVFQAFFTTKATGTGLGLAVVRRIVEGHGGSIALASATTGAEFRLRLPLDG